MTKSTQGRHFTEAARASALEVRRENALSKGSVLAPALFVVRYEAYQRLFGWEIRQFGAVLLSRSEVGYVTQAQARSAGQVALNAMVPV